MSTGHAGFGCGIQIQGGSFSLDRGTVRGGYRGVCVLDPSVLDLKNLLVWGAENVGMDLSMASGLVSFTTVASRGATGTGPTGIQCSSTSLTISSSIVWDLDSNARPGIAGGCTVTNSIVGPTAFPNTSNANPVFLNPFANDFRLSGGSPAVDMANQGPATDFEGDPRPHGARWDLGADEIK